MKRTIIFSCLTLVLMFSTVITTLGFDEGGNCVTCSIATVNGKSVFECIAATSGGNSCATSSGQQECVESGPCKPLLEFASVGTTSTGKDCPLEVKTIGDVTAKRNIVKSVAEESDVFGRVLAFGLQSGKLGNEKTKLVALDGNSSVVVVVDVIYQNSVPVALTMTRQDNFSVLELIIQQDFSSFVRGKVRWNIVSWNIN